MLKKNDKYMSRPKGSTNKSKSPKTRLETINFDKQLQNAPVNKVSNFGWINYGERNSYPYLLENLYNTSVTHRSCIDFAVNAIVGEGVDFEAMEIDSNDLQAPNYYTSWNQFIRQLAFDWCLFNAFSFQVIKNRDNSTYSFFHQPVETVRLEEMDADGVINGAYLCKDWTNSNKYGTVRLPMFGFQSEARIPMGQPFLFYHSGYNVSSPYYGAPIYGSALNVIQAEAQYQTFDLKTVTNGFTPSGALVLPDVETEEEKQAIIRRITEMFTGAENASNIMVSFRSSVEDNPVQFTPFQQNSDGVDLYQQANERTVSRLIAAHRIPSKALIGYSLDNLGFSNSAEYLESAFALYNVNVANANRQEIVNVINQAFKANGVDVELKLKPLRYSLDSTQNTTDNTESADPVSEDEATERTNNTI